MRRCFIRPADEIGNGFGSKAPQIIKDPQDFHFRETFLEVCVTHVSFSCSSSPRFDQVPVKRILRMQRILGFCHVCIEEDREKCMIYTVYPIYLIPLKMQNVLKSTFFELLFVPTSRLTRSVRPEKNSPVRRVDGQVHISSPVSLDQNRHFLALGMSQNIKYRFFVANLFVQTNK